MELPTNPKQIPMDEESRGGLVNRVTRGKIGLVIFAAGVLTGAMLNPVTERLVNNSVVEDIEDGTNTATTQVPEATVKPGITQESTKNESTTIEKSTTTDNTIHQERNNLSEIAFVLAIGGLGLAVVAAAQEEVRNRRN